MTRYNVPLSYSVLPYWFSNVTTSLVSPLLLLKKLSVMVETCHPESRRQRTFTPPNFTVVARQLPSAFSYTILGNCGPQGEPGLLPPAA